MVLRVLHALPPPAGERRRQLTAGATAAPAPETGGFPPDRSERMIGV